MPRFGPDSKIARHATPYNRSSAQFDFATVKA